MERRYIPETEARLTILYALERLGPVTDAQLLRFMAEQDLMNYITLQLSLSDLEAQGQLARQAHPCGELWVMTAEGRFALESFARRVPVSRRTLIDERAAQYRAAFHAERLAPADTVALQDGLICARLRLMEERASLMDLWFFLRAEAVPSLLEKRWQACAQTVYETVMAALTAGYRPDEPAAEVLPETVRLASDGEWLITLTDDAHLPGVYLMMPLPDERLARHCAARWPEVCRDLRDGTLELLRQTKP